MYIPYTPPRNILPLPHTSPRNIIGPPAELSHPSCSFVSFHILSLGFCRIIKDVSITIKG